MHAPAVQFKGSGWYVTDYGGKSEAPKADGGSEKSENPEKKDSASSKEDGAKGEKDKDSKPKKAEAKSEGKSESKAESKAESKTARSPRTKR